MSEPDPVPAYTATPGASDFSASQYARASYPISKNHHFILPGTQLLLANPDGRASCDVENSFFTAIKNKQSEIVAILIESKLVTLAMVVYQGRTPLIIATAAGNVRMVQELVDFGADVNEWGRWKGQERTPLMVAAAEGNLTLVKLFMDIFHADDALVAPDGQMALRLAVEGGWREVVEFLPARRGGGWTRWKVQHAVAVRRVREAVLEIYHFCEFLVWKVPKSLVWTLPKEVVFRPCASGPRISISQRRRRVGGYEPRDRRRVLGRLGGGRRR